MKRSGDRLEVYLPFTQVTGAITRKAWTFQSAWRIASSLTSRRKNRGRGHGWGYLASINELVASHYQLSGTHDTNGISPLAQDAPSSFIKTAVRSEALLRWEVQGLLVINFVSWTKRITSQPWFCAHLKQIYLQLACLPDRRIDTLSESLDQVRSSSSKVSSTTPSLVSRSLLLCRWESVVGDFRHDRGLSTFLSYRHFHVPF